MRRAVPRLDTLEMAEELHILWMLFNNHNVPERADPVPSVSLLGTISAEPARI